MTLVAGVDIGGTKIAAGLVSETGEMLRSHTVPTPAAAGPHAILNAVASAVHALGSPVAAVGVGSAGVIDSETGLVRSATDALPGWPGTDLRGELSALTGVPVSVDNDVHAHALGEVWQGAAVGYEHVLFVAVGTGIGASFVSNGKVHHGAHAVAGHAGHMPVPAASGRACTCGGQGHAEAVGCGPALQAEYQRRSRAPSVPDLAVIARKAGEGEALARDVLAEGAVALGQLVGGLVNMMDPHIVLLGGGVSSCGEHWWGPLRTAFAADALPPLRAVPVVPGQLGNDAAVLGAARLGWDLVA